MGKDQIFVVRGWQGKEPMKKLAITLALILFAMPSHARPFGHNINTEPGKVLDHCLMQFDALLYTLPSPPGVVIGHASPGQSVMVYDEHYSSDDILWRYVRGLSFEGWTNKECK